MPPAIGQAIVVMFWLSVVGVLAILGGTIAGIVWLATHVRFVAGG